METIQKNKIQNFLDFRKKWIESITKVSWEILTLSEIISLLLQLYII